MSERVIDTLVTEFGFRTNTSALRGLESRVQQVQRGLNRASRAFTIVGGTLTAGLVGTGRGILDTSRAMQTLEARTRANADQMAAFKQQAYDVGSQLPLNTADIIRAQTAFVQLGNSIDEALAATPGVAMAAVAAEGVEIEDAARYASIALNAFERDASEATDILDAMLMTETTTAANTRTLGEALRFSAKSAADAGLDYQTYIATLGVLAGSGRSAEESSQGLNVLFTKMAAAMADIGRGGPLVEEAFNAIGIEVDTVVDLMAQGPQGFVRLLERMGAAQKEFGQTTTTAALRALVGESYTAAFSYLLANTDELRLAQERAYNSMGEGARQSSIQMQGLAGAWDSLRAQLDTTVNLLGDAGVGGGLERAARGLADLIDRFNQSDDRFKEFVATALLAGPALLGMGAALRMISFALGGLVPLAKTFGTVAASSFALPLLAIAAGLVAVWAAVTYWDEIKAFLQQTGQDIADQWKADTTRMGEDWNAFTAQFQTEAGWAEPFKQMGRDFVDQWNADWSEAGDEWRAFVGSISDLWSGSQLQAQWRQDIEAIRAEWAAFGEWWDGTYLGRLFAGEVRFRPFEGVRERFGWGGDSGAPGAPLANFAPVAGGAAGSVSTSTTVVVESIEVHTPDGDPQTIAAGIRDPLVEQMHNAAEDFSSGVVR